MRFRPSSDAYTRAFNGDLVVLDVRGGEYFALNEVGTELWLGLERGKTLGEIATSVAECYEVSHQQALSDLARLCDELLARGLVTHERT